MAGLGRAALLLSFGLVAYALVAGSFAAWKRRRRLALSAQNALLAAFGTTAVAAAVLWAALARRDFTFDYVSAHISRDLPLGYALAAFWGGQEGSLLLWLLILSGYAALAVWLNRRSRDLVVWTVPVLAGVALFFAFMLCFVSSPFKTGPAPADGAGMVASLQNPYMLAHPPLLYLDMSGSRFRSPSRWARCCHGARTSAGSSSRAAGRSCRGPSSASVSCSAHWAMSRSAGAATTRGIRRERGAHAVARGDRVSPFRDDPGEARDVEGLEHGARRALHSCSRSSAPS
jgi:hypothetical protein